MSQVSKVHTFRTPNRFKKTLTRDLNFKECIKKIRSIFTQPVSFI
jgi:hypothetical protein